MKNARNVCAIFCTVAVLGYLPILFTNAFALVGVDVNIGSDPYCEFQIFNENILVQIWYWFMTFGLSSLFGPVCVLISNILLLVKLHAYFEAKKALFRPGLQRSVMKELPNAEVESAKTVVILSIATFIIVFPMTSWIAWAIVKCMPRIERSDPNCFLSTK